MVLTFAVQIAMVELGGKAVQTSPLDLKQNLICLFFGIFELIYALIVKRIPIGWFKKLSLEEKPVE